MFHKTILLTTSLVMLLLAGCGEDKQAQKPETVTTQTAPSTNKAPVTDTAPKPATAPVAKPAADKTAGATSPGSTVRDTELKEKPFIDAKTLRTLPANTALTILERQGGWMQVNAAGQQGWVRMLNVRTGTGTTTAGSDAKSVTTLATGRAGTGNIVATSGIRGLNEEQLRTAQGDPAQLQKMQSYAQSKQDAIQYAAKHGLKATEHAYLPAPERK